MKPFNVTRALARAVIGISALGAASSWATDLKVGFITSLSGPVSSLGIPTKKA